MFPSTDKPYSNTSSVKISLSKHTYNFIHDHTKINLNSIETYHAKFHFIQYKIKLFLFLLFGQRIVEWNTLATPLQFFFWVKISSHFEIKPLFCLAKSLQGSLSELVIGCSHRLSMNSEVIQNMVTEKNIITKQNKDPYLLPIYVTFYCLLESIHFMNIIESIRILIHTILIAVILQFIRNHAFVEFPNCCEIPYKFHSILSYQSQKLCQLFHWDHFSAQTSNKVFVARHTISFVSVESVEVLHYLWKIHFKTSEGIVNSAYKYSL